MCGEKNTEKTNEPPPPQKKNKKQKEKHVEIFFLTSITNVFSMILLVQCARFK